MGGDGKFPFEWFLYVGVTVLNFSEAEVWKMTPRKLIKLLDQHKKFNGLEEEKEQDVYINELGFL